MKNMIKKEKGVTMVALVITVIILLILTSMLVYNATDSVHIKALTNLYNDVELLREKVSEYYNEYGEIPARIKYTNTSELASVLSSKNDTGDFYVIDLEAMKGITLNYGKDYEKIKNDEQNADTYTDVYIINENSQNIFYVQGIKITQNNTTKTYYTDYTEPDETTVDLRYIDGILIPENYYYIGTTKDESLVISNNKEDEVNTTSTNQYIWTKQIPEIEQKPSSVTLEENQKEDEFIKSVNTYKGYFKNSEGKVQYVKIDEAKWSEAYTKDIQYTDSKGDTITIPKDCKISLAPTMNIVSQGLVIKDKNENEWVWISVPEKIFKTARADTDYDNIKADLIEYAKDYRKGGSTQELKWEDKWYDGCGIKDADTYTEKYNQMLSSIYSNYGFWIGRYEVGDSVATKNNMNRTTETGTTNKAVIQAEQKPYNYITVEQAQEISNNLAVSEKTGSLMYGIQWDLVCKFIEKNAGLKYEDIATDSTSYGNYKQLQATGISEESKILNIYDFAGNELEWTLECASDSNSYSVYRGGNIVNPENTYAMSYRSSTEKTNKNINISFRVTLF